MEEKVRFILRTLAAYCLGIFLYILFHELGHTIVMLFAGSKITEFSIIKAHVSCEGGYYTINTHMWKNVNGALLPLLLSYVFALSYNKSNFNRFYKIISMAVCLGPAFSLVAWIIIPVLFLLEIAPANDDVTQFLFYFTRGLGYSPLIVSGIAFLLLGVSIYFFYKRDILNGVAEMKKEKE